MIRAIDLFSGWGGFTEGAEQVDGIKVVWAANHWPLAVEAHKRNHPHVQHECQDLRQANWSDVPDYDALLASPACQGHSQASQPKRRHYHDSMRATAWSVVDCADVTNPRVILVENVPDFLRWRLYPQWKSALEALGYYVTETVSMATAHGVPQRRKRLFIGATRRKDFRFAPETIVEEPPFLPCLDWCAGTWRPIREAAPDARERMLNAKKRLGRFFLSQHVTNHPGVPLTEPIRTITTKDQWCVVRDDEYRPLLIREYARGMAFGDHYTWPAHVGRVDCVRGLGNAVPPPQARDHVKQIKEAA